MHRKIIGSVTLDVLIVEAYKEQLYQSLVKLTDYNNLPGFVHGYKANDEEQGEQAAKRTGFLTPRVWSSVDKQIGLRLVLPSSYRAVSNYIPARKQFIYQRRSVDQQCRIP